jgi:hypothetical protein
VQIAYNINVRAIDVIHQGDFFVISSKLLSLKIQCTQNIENITTTVVKSELLLMLIVGVWDDMPNIALIMFMAWEKEFARKKTQVKQVSPKVNIASSKRTPNNFQIS